MQGSLRWARNTLCGLGWLSAGLTGTNSAWAAEPYLLSVSDKVLVKVVAWKAATSEFEEWSALGGEYVIGADGQASFPFLGATPSAGQTTAQLADALGAEFQDMLGLTTAPTVTVEVATYGPVYVTGDVNTPGQYAFAPGLNVIKALSLAGGERRAAAAGTRPERELLTTSGALDVLQDEHMRLLVRRARLDAELAGAETVTLPPELAGAAEVDSLLAAEQAILLAKQRQMAAQTSSLGDEVTLLTRQIETFAQKRQTMEAQLAQAQEQLTRISQLSESGLALASRVTSLETSVADLEGRLLDVDTASLQARQDISAAERQSAELADRRVSEVSLERQTVDGDIAALALKISSQQSLLSEAALYAGALPGSTGPQAVYAYSIIRDGEQIDADIATPVQAGDVIVATLELATL